MAEKTQNPGQSTQTTAPKAPAGPIQAPAPGQNIELKVVVGQNIVLTAGFEQATPTVEGSKLIFEFANGGQVVLDFSDIGDAPLPNVVLADGSVLSVTDYLAVLGLEDIETAAGPDAGNQDSGGVGAYLDDAGDILDGVDKLGPQGPRNFGALLLEPIESAADDEDSVPLLLGPDSVLVEDEEMIEGIEEDEMPDLPGAVSGTVLDNVDWGVDAFGGVIGIVVGTETISVGASTTVYWAQDGTFLGTDGTGAAASLLVNGDGTYTFTLLDNMLLGQGVQDEQIDLLATVQIIGIDTDDDTVSIPLSLSVQDDVPVVSAIDPVQLDDDALPGGIPGGVGDDVDAVNVSGTLGHDFGADGGSIAWLTDGAPEGFSYESADGTTLLVKQGDVVVLTLTLDAATGAYTVTQNAPIMHASGDDENNQLFTFGYQVTDGDGDTAKGSLSLNVDDDTPVVQSIETATVEDEEMPGGIDEVDSPEYGKVVNGSVVDNVNWGADGFGSLSTFSLGGDSFTAGQTVYWNQAGTFLGTLSTGAAASLLVNGDGTYTFTLLDNVLLGQGIQGEQINQLASLSLTGADKDGDPVTIGLNLDVKDDIPVVTTPTDVLTVEDEKMSGGNDEADGLLGVIDGSIVDNVNWGADGFGAASGFTVGGQSFAAGQTVFWAQNGAFLGTSGPGAAFLTVNTDGTYSFGLSDNMLLGQNIQGEQTDFLGEVTITGADADGDTVSVLLDLNVNDDIPTVSANSSVLVDDDAQPNGNPGGIGDDVDPVNASGTLGHSFGADGGSIAWLTTGAPDDFSYESTDGTTLLVKQGDVTVLTLTLDSATGAYTVAQNAPIMHAPGDDENNQDFTFTYRVTDGDGDIVDGTLAVSVDDDTPVLTEGSIAHIVDEDDIKTDWSRGTSPDDNNADGSWTGHPSYVTGGPAYVFGSLSSLVSFGADGKGSFGFTSDAIAQLEALHLFSKQTAVHVPENGLALTYSVSSAGGVVTLMAREPDHIPGGTDTGNPVFELQLNTSTGDYKFYLYDELIHKAPTDGGADENFELRSGNDGATVDTLNFGKLIQAVDTDGDAVILDGKFTVQVRDDIPEVDVDYEFPYVKVLHDETAGYQDDDTSSGSVASRFASLLNTGNDEDVAGSGAIGFARSGAAIVQVDGLNTQTGADAPALVSKYSFDLLNSASGLTTTEGETITLSKDSAGRIVGTVEGDGAHGGTIAFAVAINESNGEVFVAQYLSLKHPNTSSHDESVDLSGKLAVRYTITDSDGDTVSDQLPMGSQIQFDDDGPTVSRNAQVSLDDDALSGGNPGTPAVGDSNPDSVNTSGTLGHSFGADGGSISWLLTGNTSGFTYESGANNSLLVKQGGTVVLTLTLNPADGAYTVVQNAPIIHSSGGNENNTNITIGYRVTDGDGDKADGTLTINVDDDTPTVSLNAQVSLDDDALSGGNPGTPAVSDDVDSANTSGTLGHSFGADGGSISWLLTGNTSGFTYESGANNSLLVKQGGTVVLTLTLNPADGAYTVAQNAPIIHSPGGNENNTNITIGYRVTDGDGDKADGTLTINVDDDTPTVTVQDGDLLSESFEGFAPGLGTPAWTVVGEGGGTIPGNGGITWNVNSAGIEIQSGGAGGSAPSDGLVHAELDAHNQKGGDPSTLTVLSTNVVLPGSEVTVTFDYRPRPADMDDSGMKVTLGGVSVTIQSDNSGVLSIVAGPGVIVSHVPNAGAPGWSTFTLAFSNLPVGPATLEFAGLSAAVNGDTTGAYLDNINMFADTTLTVDETNLELDATADFSGFFDGSYGADGPGTTAFTLGLNTTESGLVDTATGEDIVLKIVAGAVEGRTETTNALVFTVTVSAAGVVTLDQDRAVMHDNPSDPNDPVSLDGAIKMIATVTDADNDPVNAHLGIGLTFLDDGPLVTANGDVLLDDDALAKGNPGDTGSGTDDVNSANATGTLGHVFGADNGSISWLTTGNPDGFTYEAGADNSLLVKQGGTLVLTLALDSDTGDYTVTQNAAIKHGTGDEENNQLFTIGYRVTDGDGDTKDGSLTINVDDDTPTVRIDEPNGEENPVSFTVKYLGGEAGYNNSFGYYIKNADGTPKEGVVLWDNVKDETGDGDGETFELPAGVTPDQIGFFIIPNGENLNFSGSEADGTAVTFAQVGGVGGKWMASVDGTALKGEGNPVYFSDENLNNDGQSHVQDVPSGTNTRGGNFNWEDLVISINSSDKDYDDVDMTLTWNNVTLLVKDAGVPGSEASMAVGTDLVTFAFGADGPAASDSKAFELVVMVGNTGLFDTATGDEVLIKLADPSDPTTVIGYVTDGVTDTTVFEVTVDSDGTVTVTQERAVMHPTNNPHEIANLGDEVLYLRAIATDGDGDTATDEFDLGKAINFQDVGPSAEDDSLTVTLGGEVNDYELGNVLTNDLHEGKVDGAEAEVVFLRAGGDRTYNTTDFFADDLATEVQAEGTYGFLTLDRYGNASYVLKDGFSGSEGSLVDNFNYQMKDADGDTDVANITVTIQNGIEVRAFAVQIDDQPSIEISAADDRNEVHFRIESSDGSTDSDFASEKISGDVLDNDSDGLTVIGVSTENGTMSPVDDDGTTIIGEFGTLTLHSGGGYDYTLNAPADPESLANQPTDSFDYQAQDAGGNMVTATLTIDILDEIHKGSSGSETP